MPSLAARRMHHTGSGPNTHTSANEEEPSSLSRLCASSCPQAPSAALHRRAPTARGAPVEQCLQARAYLQLLGALGLEPYDHVADGLAVSLPTWGSPSHTGQLRDSPSYTSFLGPFIRSPEERREQTV